MNSSRRGFTTPDYITISNGVLGFLAITYVIDGIYWLSSLIIVICIGLDGLDGWLARKLDKEHLLGTYMDIFADTLSFCFAPALLVYSHYYDLGLGRSWQSFQNGASTIVPMMLVFFGILRLGRFSRESKEQPYFNGLPTPMIALLVVLLSTLFGIDGVLAYRPILVLAITFVLGSLLYSNIPYPKLRGRKYTIAGAVVLVVTLIGLISAKNSYPMGTLLLLSASTICCLYVIIGPLKVLKYDKKDGPGSE